MKTENDNIKSNLKKNFIKDYVRTIFGLTDFEKINYLQVPEEYGVSNLNEIVNSINFVLRPNNPINFNNAKTQYLKLKKSIKFSFQRK